MRAPLKERLLAKIRIHSDGCWEWTASRNPRGYGLVFDGKMRPAHIVSYEQFTGLTVPDGLELHHTCFYEPCIHPFHLEPRTHQQNCMETALAGRHHNQLKTECVHRHQFTPKNTGRDHRGHRFCRQCKGESRIRNA
jgi:hypothetical protein